MQFDVKTGFAASVKVFLLVSAMLILVKLLPGLPWWGFAVPTLLVAAVLMHYNWRIPYFIVGFWAGFVVWVCGNLFFHYWYGGTLLDKFGPSMKYAAVAITGLVGGLVCGLAMYTGKELVFDKEKEYSL